MPAVTLSSADSVMAFGRRRDGAFLRRSSLDGGSSWQAPIEFPAGVFTSGVAACASSDGQTLYVAGRGTDNQIWYGRSSDGGARWEGFFPISGGTFQSGAAITGARRHRSRLRHRNGLQDLSLQLQRRRQDMVRLGSHWSGRLHLRSGQRQHPPMARSSTSSDAATTFVSGTTRRFMRALIGTSNGCRSVRESSSPARQPRPPQEAR